MGPGIYYKMFLISSGIITHLKWFLKNLNKSLSPLKEYSIYSVSVYTGLPVVAIESNQIILDTFTELTKLTNFIGIIDISFPKLSSKEHRFCLMLRTIKKKQKTKGFHCWIYSVVY